jgi:predicted GNAT family N-acyltransferase
MPYHPMMRSSKVCERETPTSTDGGVHRQCWAVTVDDELAGLVVRKDESHAEACTRHIVPKILKICTFKVKLKFRGEKLGELLLKQILWFAFKNSYDLVYLTTFSDQIFLIQILEYFGFQKTGVNSFQEEIYEKPLLRARLRPHERPTSSNLHETTTPFCCAAPGPRVLCPYQRRISQHAFS